MHIVDKQPQTGWYPGNLTELLWLVTRPDLPQPRPVKSEEHICGSHWAMSEAAVTPGQMIETATPVHEDHNDQTAPRLNHVLYDVIPGCMTQDALQEFIRQDVKAFDPKKVPPDTDKFYLFHVEAGMRIYEVYAYMDSGDDGLVTGDALGNGQSLARYVEKHKGELPTSYLGPWALETMGGAGGQTIAGVASTATHGGDLAYSAIGDAIVALHLIAPDGQEYWIERSTILPTRPQQFKLVDEATLQAHFAEGHPSKPGGEFRSKKIIYKQDDDLMNAAIVSCGRMGIIYSVVVRAIRPFALGQDITTPWWDDVRTWVADVTHPTNVATFGNHFVEIDIDVYPKPVFDWHTAAWLFGAGVFGPGVFVGLTAATVGLYAGLHGHKYRAWVITRKLLPLDKANIGTPGNPTYSGREERGGANTAGKMPQFKADPDQGTFRNPCDSANWLRQFLQDVRNELEDIRDDAAKQWLIAGGAAAFLTITAPPLAAALVAYQGVCMRVALFCHAWIFNFTAISEVLPDDMAFGDFVSCLLNTFSDLHAHSIVQLLYWLGANKEHGDPNNPLTAISYAVMDTHNYRNKGCIAPGDSIEFFMDGTTPELPSFIDYALDQVRALADEGQGFGGYISLRFMKDSASFLAMQRWPRTCSIEIAGLSKVAGCGPYHERLEEESRKRNIVLHWGQRNNRSQKDLETVFSPTTGGPLYRWRDALSVLSEHGRLDNFSTDYTRFKGLEITQPRLYLLTASLTDGCENDITTITYDGVKNPPETQLTLRQRFADGRTLNVPVDAANRTGTVHIPLGQGPSTIELGATRSLLANTYPAVPLEVELHGFRTGDSWDSQGEAELRQVDTVARWYLEMNLFSQFISDTLRVSAVALTAQGGGDWIVRNADIGADLTFTAGNATVQLPSTPVFNRNWEFFSAAPADTSSLPPTVFLRFTIVC
jgi:hypothetical protein